VIWGQTERGPRVLRVVLSNAEAGRDALADAALAGASEGSCPAIAALADRIAAFLAGEAIAFELDLVALELCSPFQRRVLLAEHAIPRGRVSTYGRIAAYLDLPRAARAVGTALARNPFPILIPCHRAVRADGSLGGYQGGRAMKRALLEREGVLFDSQGRALVTQMHY